MRDPFPTPASAPVLRYRSTPGPRRPDDRIVPRAIVRCLSEGRRPAPDEVEGVAARIWHDIHAGAPKLPWHRLEPGSTPRRRVVAAACAALGGAGSAAKPP